jgi:hypothetical protein
MESNTPHQNTSVTEQAENQIKMCAQQFIDALHGLEDGSEDDASQLVELFATEAELTNSALELRGSSATGHDQILRFWIDYKTTLNGARSNFHHITTSERAAGLFWTTEGKASSGDEVRYHGATLLDFDETGMIVFFRGYYDTRELTVRADQPTT